MWNQFSSRAILKNVSYIETCSIGVRCLGMILTYLDGHEKVLGQWYEHHPSPNAVIHTLEPIPDQGLRFFLSYEDVDEYRYSYLESVELRSVKHGNDIHTVCDGSMVDVNYGATIVWYFSTKSDVIDVD
ncbi:hypothetical protein N7488_000352 [Penicillium malachiteum]|nr:hypothetical protein N7488_000352 [Penicillium malachiteum]